MTITGAGEITIEYDDGPGGTLTDITEHVQSEFAIGVANIMQNIRARGDTGPQEVASGNVQMEDITLSGFWDSGSGSPETVFRLQDDDKSPFGATRSLRVTVGTTLQLDVETRLISYRRIRRYPGALLYEAIVRPTGTVTETDL